MRATPRSRSCANTKSPIGRPSRLNHAPLSDTGAPRHREVCCTTAMSSTTRGTIVDAVIVPPTSQNQSTIERDLWRVVEDNLDLDDAALTGLCEQTIRNYDPCISCAAHFLDLTREAK